MHLRKETCYECEKHLRYMESSPAKQMGVTMHMGERFCTGGKRARKFKRNDPKIYVPSWCPRRKIPSELRVYTSLSYPVPLFADFERLVKLDPASLEYGLIKTQLVKNKNRINDALFTISCFADLYKRILCV